jgi:polyhydroxyalkanoate synthesis regulator phasin
MRIVYTCQKPQHKKCKFFLWQSDAEPREKANLLQSDSGGKSLDQILPDGFTTASALHRAANEESPGQSSTNPNGLNSYGEEDIGRAALKLSPPPDLPETPRKVSRVEGQLSPRSWRSSSLRTPSPPKDEVFLTPATQRDGITSTGEGLITPRETPAAARFRSALVGDPPPFNLSPAKRQRHDLGEDLSSELLDGLKDMGTELTAEATAFVKTVCVRHAKQAQGIEKGRDVARAVVKKKDRRIAELEDRVAELEEKVAELEAV